MNTYPNTIADTEGYRAFILAPDQEPRSENFLQWEEAQDWLLMMFNYGPGVPAKPIATHDPGFQALVVDNTNDRTIAAWEGTGVEIVHRLFEAVSDYITGVDEENDSAEWTAALTSAGYTDISVTHDLGARYVLFVGVDGRQWALADDNTGETSSVLLSRNIYCDHAGVEQPPYSDADELEVFVPIYGTSIQAVVHRAHEAITDWE